MTSQVYMAVDERSSPQTGDQLRTKNTNETSAACEGAAASDQPQVCRIEAAAAEYGVDQATMIGAGRGGRGRRKQCRPVRVCFREDDVNVDDVVAVEAKPPEVDSLLPEVVDLPAQNVCELCGAEETTLEALATHATTCRGRSNHELPTGCDGGAFPTPYHELGSELMRGADTAMSIVDGSSEVMPVDCSLAYVDDRAGSARYRGRSEELDGDEFDAPLDFTLHSTSSSSSSSSGVDVGSTASSAAAAAALAKQPPEMTSPVAVLVGADAEDFCEFCQKRFCNKYYLRKHRHDVHGVTTSDSQPQHQSASNFLPHSDTLPLSTAHDEFVATSSASTSAQQQLPFQTQMMTSLQPFVLPFQTSTSTTNSMLFQSPTADLATSPGAAAAAGLLPGLTSLMLLNPFASSLALLNSPSFLHQTSPVAAAAYSASSSLNTLAELQKTNTPAVGSGFGGLCDDVAALGALMNPFLPPSDPASAINIDDPLSSSHYCELCRKEFCSAYFLAVHRREKHGIATSTALSDAIRLLAAGNGRPGGVLECLGGGAEPGEKLTSSNGAAGRIGKSQSDRSSTHADTSRSTNSERLSSDHVCCLCKKQFPNRYGLVLHLLSAHNIRPEGFGLAGELLQLDGVGGRPQSTAAASGKGSLQVSGLPAGPSTASSSSSSSSSKQSDRVSCDVCNKEVCNKYFLKTHKMKVHGMDSVAAAIYNPPPPPLDSTRSEAARSPASVSSTSRQHQQQQHDEMRKALLMADSQFSSFASHLDFALKSAASADAAGSAGFGALPPPSLQQQHQQPGEPLMTASDIFRLFGLGTKPDDPFMSLGLPPPPPPPLSLQSLLPGSELCDPGTDAAKHSKPVELKIPKHVAGMSHHHKDVVGVGLPHQQSGRVKHSTGHHNGRHGRDQGPAAAAATQPPGVPRQSLPSAALGPSDQELIQSGIDPEAYCELCQKEFCSKYFLRTHRQKIHGVSASKSGDTAFDHYRPMSQQSAAAAAANPVLQMFPGLPLPTQPMFGSGPSALLPSTPVVDPSSDSVGVGRTGSKEAANATRVTCDVCGKELCNKYFLKTHMAKIHGCTTAQGGSGVELDVGESAPDTADNQSVPAAEEDCRVARDSPPYEKYLPVGGSLGHGHIPPLPADNMPPYRPNSRNYLRDLQPRENSESAESRVKTLSDHLRSTQAAAVAGSEAVGLTMENGERSLPDTNDACTAKTDTENISSDPGRGSEADALHDGVRSEKRALASCDASDAKRPRTDIVVEQADNSETEEHDRCNDVTGNSGVIQFVSRSKDSMSRPREDADEVEEKCSETGPGISESGELPAGRAGDDDAPWFTTVNGHAEPGRRTRQSGVCDDQQQQPSSPVMQPFIVRQEPLAPPGGGLASTDGPRYDLDDDTTQFAACQLMLPVVRPIRDPLSVEFSITPVSSD